MLARAFLAAVLGSVFFSPAGYAAGREVLVRDNAYDPDAVQIQAGDHVVWRWASDNANFHTVTAAVDGSFDSDDGNCGDAAQCRGPGRLFTQQFSKPGIYAYRCKVHAFMLGRVVVTEAKPPPEQPPPAGPVTSPPPGEGQPGPQPEADSQRPPQSQAPRPAGPRQAAPAGPPPRRPRMAAVPGMTSARAPVAPPAPRGETPAVAPARDPLSVLPPARRAPIAPEAPAEPPAQLAVEVPAGQPGQRTGLVVGIAVATLLATAGAFGKIVLFGRP